MRFWYSEAALRFLRNGVVYHSEHTVEAAMKTACILHNLLIIWDGRDIASWEDEVMWDHLDPDLQEHDNAGAVAEDDDRDRSIRRNGTPVNDIHERTFLPDVLNMHDLPEGPSFGKYDHHNLQHCLQQHFTWAYQWGEVQWPKGFMNGTKSRLTLRNMDTRARRGAADALYSRIIIVLCIIKQMLWVYRTIFLK